MPVTQRPASQTPGAFFCTAPDYRPGGWRQLGSLCGNLWKRWNFTEPRPLMEFGRERAGARSCGAWTIPFLVPSRCRLPIRRPRTRGRTSVRAMVLGAVAAPLGALLGGVRPSFGSSAEARRAGRSRSGEPRAHRCHAHALILHAPARPNGAPAAGVRSAGGAGVLAACLRRHVRVCVPSERRPGSGSGPTGTGPARRVCGLGFVSRCPTVAAATETAAERRRQRHAHRLVRQRGGSEQRRRGDRAHRAGRAAERGTARDARQSCGPRWRRPATA